ncbi:hypothetical protein [Naasia sp. SYSU D00057]|uniref:hypothetical protein n=1 Tax=Naasia sp. SYSU D00057 TaxID=2817380 RepID=UPI001B307187|nr:hypothetical protein [Naasia sp. SYSU D00057]
MSLALTRRPELVLGAAPRANLLPPSVVAARRGRRVLRLLLLAVVAAAVVVALAIGGASFAVAGSAASLQAERAKSDALLAEQAEYSDVTALLSDRTRLTSERALAAATDVDWAAYLLLVRGTLADGMALVGADVTATTPLEQIVQPTAPLQSARVATLVLTASAPDLPAVEQWLADLQTLPGYADAIPGAITVDQDGNLQAQVTVGVSDAAYSHRFDPEGDR